MTGIQDADTTDDSATITLTASGGGVSDTATVTVTITDDDTPLQAPGTPSTPTRTASTTSSLTLATNPGSGGTPASYRWRISGNSTVTDSDPMHTSTGPSITITGLSEDTLYWIDVRAENSEGDSAYSGDLATSTDDTALTAPGDPGAPTLSSRTSSSLTLACPAPTSGGAPTTYRWRYSTNNIISGSDPDVTSTGPSVTISGLAEDDDYWIAVRAENSAGDSDFVEATTDPFRTLAGTPTTTVTASAGADKTVASGGTVQF